MRRLVVLLLLGVACSTPAFAQQGIAGCTVSSGMTLPNTTQSFYAPRDSAPPVMLSNQWITNSGWVLSCGGYNIGVDFYTFVNPTQASTGQYFAFEGKTYEIYTTPITGVGVILDARDTGNSSSDFIPVTSATDTKLWTSVASTAQFSVSMAFRARFVATGPLRAGMLSIPGFTILKEGVKFSNQGPLGYAYAALDGANFTMNLPTCNLSVPAKVTLPMIDASTIGLAGTASSDTPFRIDLNCGSTRVASNVRYTLTDISNTSNVTSTLGLLGGSATGVALQVLENGVPVRFGPDSPLAGNTNQRDFGLWSTSGGRISKDLTVRYIRTGDPLRPGSLSAGVSVTMSYQ